MGSLTLFLTSLGLSMDACAVSISNGMCYKYLGKKQILLTGFAFGFFQAFMPLIGYIIGSTFSDAISSIDHWIALVLLVYIGGKMIVDAIQEMKNPESCAVNSGHLPSKTLLLQSVATSIDALAVGVGFAVIKVDIYFASMSIGLITFVTSIVGSILGKKFGQMFKQKAVMLGGVILVFIGLKIFIEHTM